MIYIFKKKPIKLTTKQYDIFNWIDVKHVFLKTIVDGQYKCNKKSESRLAR